MLIGGTLAYFTDEDHKENRAHTGRVHISLEEPTFEENTEGTYKMDVLPNQTVVKDPTITVEEGSADCYVRVRMDIKGLEDLKDNFDVAYADQLEDALLVENDAKELIPLAEYGWNKNEEDGYYYFTDKQSAKDQIHVFDALTIPRNWGNEVKKKTITLEITAEAIQAEGFKPKQDKEGKIRGWEYSDGSQIDVETYEITQDLQ